MSFLWSFGLGAWFLVRAWSWVLGPALVRSAALVLGPAPLWFVRVKSALPTAEHFRDALVQRDQLGRLLCGQVVTTRRGVIAGLQFPVRGKGVSQKLQHLFVATPQESLGDVEHHRERSIVDLVR